MLAAAMAASPAPRPAQNVTRSRPLEALRLRHQHLALENLAPGGRGTGGQRQGGDQRAVIPEVRDAEEVSLVDEPGGEADNAEREDERPIARPWRWLLLLVLRLGGRRGGRPPARPEGPARQGQEEEHP